MAVQFINIDTNQRLGADLRRSVDVARESRDRLAKHKAIMDTLVDGVDYSAIATRYGVQPAEAQTLYNLVAGAAADVGTANVVNLLNRCG